MIQYLTNNGQTIFFAVLLIAMFVLSVVTFYFFAKAQNVKVSSVDTSQNPKKLSYESVLDKVLEEAHLDKDFYSLINSLGLIGLKRLRSVILKRKEDLSRLHVSQVKTLNKALSEVNRKIEFDFK